MGVYKGRGLSKRRDETLAGGLQGTYIVGGNDPPLRPKPTQRRASLRSSEDSLLIEFGSQYNINDHILLEFVRAGCENSDIKQYLLQKELFRGLANTQTF